MAKSVAIVGVAAIVVACTSEGGDRGAEQPTVLTTFTVLADIAANVAGEHLLVESITKPGAEIHGYEPTPGDIRKAATADLILDNGLGLEAWFAQFVDGLDVPHVVVSEGVAPLNITGDSSGGAPNPHAWMSPLNVQVYADNMAGAFAELDPAHAQAYRDNAAAYRGRLQQVHDDLVAELQALPSNHRALVTCEGAFSYLARDAGLTEKYIWAVNAEQQATPSRSRRSSSSSTPTTCPRSSVNPPSPMRRCSASWKPPAPVSAGCCSSIRSLKPTVRCRRTSTSSATTPPPSQRR